jgi:hypothetical protein
MQRVMTASNKMDEISKFDRLLRLVTLCGALARHPQNLEMICAGGKCSLVSAVFKVIGFALPPADCRSISEASTEMKGCSSLQDELHALADGHPNATMILRKASHLSHFCSVPTSLLFSVTSFAGSNILRRFPLPSAPARSSVI